MGCIHINFVKITQSQQNNKKILRRFYEIYIYILGEAHMMKGSRNNFHAAFINRINLIHGSRITSQWRHNGRDGASNHKPHDGLLNRLFGRRPKRASKLRVTGLCEGNSPVNSPHKGPVTWKRFPLDDVIMQLGKVLLSTFLTLEFYPSHMTQFRNRMNKNINSTVILNLILNPRIRLLWFDESRAKFFRNDWATDE